MILANALQRMYVEGYYKQVISSLLIMILVGTHPQTRKQPFDYTKQSTRSREQYVPPGYPQTQRAHAQTKRRDMCSQQGDART